MTRFSLLFCTLLVVSMGLGCATPRIGKTYQFFDASRGNPPDPWTPKIEDWQTRERADLQTDVFEVTELNRSSYPFGDLRPKFNEFLGIQRRALARAILVWSQQQARRHYRADPETDLAGDPWPTLRQLFDTNGDDCDGLDLIAYAMLRESGFPEDQLYRAIVMRDRDRENHMVTLWFDDPEDPWVIDTTGAITLEMKKFSDLPPEWTPLRMFNETSQYTVVKKRGSGFALAGE